MITAIAAMALLNPAQVAAQPEQITVATNCSVKTADPSAVAYTYSVDWKNKKSIDDGAQY